MFEKKYTIEEFKEMFDEAEKRAIEKLDSDMQKAKEANGKERNFSDVIFTMQNMLAMSTLKQELFKEEI